MLKENYSYYESELDRLANQLLVVSGELNKQDYSAYGLVPVWSEKYEKSFFDEADHTERTFTYQELYDRSTQNEFTILILLSGLQHNTLFIPYLTSVQKEVLSLLLCSGLSPAQTAKALNKSKSAISQTIKRIKNVSYIYYKKHDKPESLYWSND